MAPKTKQEKQTLQDRYQTNLQQHLIYIFIRKNTVRSQLHGKTHKL